MLSLSLRHKRETPGRTPWGRAQERKLRGPALTLHLSGYLYPEWARVSGDRIWAGGQVYRGLLALVSLLPVRRVCSWEKLLLRATSRDSTQIWKRLGLP